MPEDQFQKRKAYLTLIIAVIAIFAFNFFSSPGKLVPGSALTALPPCSVISFTADPAEVSTGGSSVLSWSVSASCVRASIIPEVANISSTSGTSTTFPLSETTTFTLTAYDKDNNPSTSQLSVQVK